MQRNLINGRIFMFEHITSRHILISATIAFALASEYALANDASAPAAPAAAAPVAPAMPALPAELSQYDFFLGTWSCSGKAFASPMGAEHATTATLHVVKAVGGRWVHLTYDEDKSAANPAPFHAGLYWGYDAGKKVFVQNCVDVFGGYCQQTSAGWSGDSFVFEGAGVSDGQAGKFRDSLTRKDASTVMHAGEAQGADQRWAKTDEETCHKAK